MPTTNNNWPTPVATDLVKDGWEAIKDLGDAIDTTLGVYADPGLVHIETRTVTGVTSEQFNNVFSTTYDNYLVIANLGVSSTGVATFRVRASGTDNNSAEYSRQQLTGAGTSGVFTVDTGQTSAGLGTIGDTNRNHHLITFFEPFVSGRRTAIQLQRTTNAITDPTVVHFNYTVNNTAQYDGFTFFAGAGNLTNCLVSIYGYRK